MRFCGLYLLFICMLVIFCNGFGCVETSSRWGNIPHATPVGRTIIVDKSGGGDFTRIQSAINSIPSGNTQWIRIILRPDIYWEQVRITPDKQYIILEGHRNQRTVISWDNAEDTEKSATIYIQADNFLAKWIHFENTYNYGNRNERKPAVAAAIGGDKSAFYHCGFYGVQDTLWDVSGRHFFFRCHIQGSVDFIFGDGQSIYQECKIVATAEGLLGPGYVTAQGRENSNDPSGFVFKSCYLEGNGQVYLGRPWRPYARVLFYNSYLSNVVVPQGWVAWNSNIATVSYAEHQCRGPGSDLSRRSPYVNKGLSHSELTQLTSLSFINSDGWLQKQP